MPSMKVIIQAKNRRTSVMEARNALKLDTEDYVSDDLELLRLDGKRKPTT